MARERVEIGAVKTEYYADHEDRERMIPACNWYPTSLLEPGTYKATDGRILIVTEGSDEFNPGCNSMFII